MPEPATGSQVWRLSDVLGWAHKTGYVWTTLEVCDGGKPGHIDSFGISVSNSTQDVRSSHVLYNKTVQRTRSPVARFQQTSPTKRGRTSARRSFPLPYLRRLLWQWRKLGHHHRWLILYRKLVPKPSVSPPLYRIVRPDELNSQFTVTEFSGR